MYNIKYCYSNLGAFMQRVYGANHIKNRQISPWCTSIMACGAQFYHLVINNYLIGFMQDTHCIGAVGEYRT